MWPSVSGFVCSVDTFQVHPHGRVSQYLTAFYRGGYSVMWIDHISLPPQLKDISAGFPVSVRNSAAMSKVLARAGRQEEEKGIHTIKGSEASCV